MAKILVVDDESQFAEMIKMRLEANEYEVIIARSGQEGLDKAKSENPDLIVLDVMMPDISGYEACRLLKKDSQCNKIPVIICTGKALPPEVEKASRESKAEDYIVKPFESGVFLAKIAELLKRS